MANQKLENMWNMLSFNILKIDHLITDDLICIECKKVLINAHQAPCGCKFCKTCIHKYTEMENSLCPGNKEECREEILSMNDNISVDHRANNIISRLQVKCPHEGCDFECQLKNMYDHLHTCEMNLLISEKDVKTGELVRNGDHKLIEMINNLMNAVNSFIEREDKMKIDICMLKEMIENINLEMVDFRKVLGEKEITNINQADDKQCTKIGCTNTIEKLKAKLIKREIEIGMVIRESDTMKKVIFFA